MENVTTRIVAAVAFAVAFMLARSTVSSTAILAVWVGAFVGEFLLAMLASGLLRKLDVVNQQHLNMLACAITAAIFISVYTLNTSGYDHNAFQAALVTYIPPILVVYMALERQAMGTRIV